MTRLLSPWKDILTFYTIFRDISRMQPQPSLRDQFNSIPFSDYALHPVLHPSTTSWNYLQNGTRWKQINALKEVFIKILRMHEPVIPHVKGEFRGHIEIRFLFDFKIQTCRGTCSHRKSN
jgi:hypothetical protein